MSYFTPKQDKALKTVLDTIIRDNNHPNLVALIQENDLLSAADKDPNLSLVMENVHNVSLNEHLKLTDEEARCAAYIVIDEYDESDYNQCISEAIDRALQKLGS